MDQKSELTLKQVTQIFARNWVLFFGLCLAMAVAATGFYIYKVPYVSQVSISVKDSKNSALQAFASQFSNLTTTVTEGKKGNTQMVRQMDHLKSTAFLADLYQSIYDEQQAVTLSFAETAGRKNLLKVLGPKLAATDEKYFEKIGLLEALVQIRIDTDSRITVQAKNMDAQQALYLSNLVATQSQKSLTTLESEEIELIALTLRSKLTLAEKNKTELFRQLQGFQSQRNNVLSVSSGQKVGDYLSDLMIRKSEIKMRINENQRQIADLKKTNTTYRVSSAYGRGGQIESLESQNQSLRTQLDEIEYSMAQVSKVASVIPTAQFTFQEIEQKLKNEEKEITTLNDLYEKAMTQMQLIPARYSLLDRSRPDMVNPEYSLFSLLALALVISVLVGGFVIYVYALWDDSHVNPRSRNVVVINTEDFDPRVVIEDSKVKFRLKSDRLSATDDGNDLSEKRLTFRLFEKRDEGFVNENR